MITRAKQLLVAASTDTKDAICKSFNSVNLNKIWNNNENKPPIFCVQKYQWNKELSSSPEALNTWSHAKGRMFPRMAALPIRSTIQETIANIIDNVLLSLTNKKLTA